MLLFGRWTRIIKLSKMKELPALMERTLREYIEKHRPPEEIRDKLDIGYSHDKQSIFLEEIRPRWDKPEIIMRIPYAKIRYIKSQNIFKLYWQRASLKWELYEPFPESTHLQKLLDVVTEDGCGCFRG